MEYSIVVKEDENFKLLVEEKAPVTEIVIQETPQPAPVGKIAAPVGNNTGNSWFSGTSWGS